MEHQQSQQQLQPQTGPTAAPHRRASAGSAGGSAAALAVHHLSSEVIRKLRLAGSAETNEDRAIVCEEVFGDVTGLLDAVAQVGGGEAAGSEASWKGAPCWLGHAMLRACCARSCGCAAAPDSLSRCY